MSAMLVVTTEHVPGYEVIDIIGEVVGVTARTHNPFAEGVRALTGELNPKIRQALASWRHEAVTDMMEQARKLGANAVVGMRFDNREIATAWAEICAYGTAVRVEVATAATAGAGASGAAGPPGTPGPS